MNIKRILFWFGFVVVIVLIIWGLIVAAGREPVIPAGPSGEPVPISAEDHVRGADDAAVTLIEYSDLQCPACAAYYPLIERLLNESSTTVRFAYRHFPLYPLPHKNALVASYASEASALQGKFWEMYQMLFENQASWSDVRDAKPVFEGYAERIGLDMERYRSDIDSDAVKARVDRDVSDAERLGVNATPTFFVNGRSIPNPQSYESFKSTIDTAALGGTQ